MAEQRVATHEMLELHELITFKTVCLTKSKTMQNLATDDALKSILQADVQNSTKDIQEIKGVLSAAHKI